MSRESLLTRLNDRNWRVGVVSGPAGFGKSTLLATWAATTEHGVWLSCDTADEEPVRFWTALAVALASRWPGVGDDLLKALERTGLDDLDGAVSLANDLADVACPVEIVVDDVHLARPAPDVLARFIGALPTNVRIVLSSRLGPPFSVARMRVTGQLLELRSDDLRFNQKETAALLENNDVELDDDELGRLHGLTEGWPAAIQLAAMSLRRRPDQRRFLDAFASTDLAITDFLVNEVLTEIPTDWVEFLGATCVLDEFDADLCARMTGRDDSGAVIQQLLAAGLFVIPLGDTGDWYRYHHLFAAFLRARLRSSGRRRYGELVERAVAALESRGMAVPAMRLAIASGDIDRAAQIVRRSWERGSYPADLETSSTAARLWLNEFGERSIDTDPVRVLALATAAWVNSTSDEMAGWLTRTAAAHPDPDPLLGVYLHGNWIEYYLERGAGDDAISHIEPTWEAMGRLTPEQRDSLLVHPQHVFAYLEVGDFDAARAAADTWLRTPTGRAALDLVRVPSLRAWVAYLDGELALAERLAESVQRHADDLDLGDHEPGRTYAGLVTAGVRAERMDDAAAAVALDEARRRADLFPRPLVQRAVALQEAAFARVRGDADAAQAHLAVARSLAPLASPTVIARFDLEQARQLVQFQPWTARTAIQALGGGPAADLLLARYEIEMDDPAAAAAALARVPPSTTRRQHVEIALARALIAPTPDGARYALIEALEIAAPARFVRTVIGAGPGVAHLLDTVPAGPFDEYVETLVKAAAATASTRRGESVALVDALSAAELNVLRYLSSRLTNREIAVALYVSVNTLKTHVKSVYRKLDVSSRGEAVEAGRQLRLI